MTNKRNRGMNRKRGSNGTSRTAMARWRDGASRTMMRGYNGNSTERNKAVTRKRNRGSMA